MTGISDQFTVIGNEAVAWGTRAATLTRGIEAQPSGKPQPRVEHRPSTGFRPGRLGDPTDTHVVDVRGGTYPLVFDLLNKSHSMVLAAAGSVAITTPSGATTARLHTITPSDSALASTTILDGVALKDGTIDHIEYLGAKLTQLGLSLSPRGNVQVSADYDYRTLNTAASSATPAYASSPYVYRDTDVTTTLGGTEICQRSIDLAIPTGAQVDRDRICPGGREEPTVVGRIRPTGTISPDFASVGYLNDWVAGTSRSLVVEATGPEIESGFDFFVRVTFAAVKFTGEVYERSLEDMTGQPLPFQAFDNGSDPLWKIEYQTSDTAI